MTTTSSNAIVYVCEPDAAASIAAADDLVGAAEARGMSVRAVVADTAARDSALDIRRGWAVVSPLLAAGDSTLVVRSRADLGRSEGHQAMAGGPLCDGRVTALMPEPWEDQDWIRAWRAPERGAARAVATDCGQFPGMCCAVFPARDVHVAHARRMTRRFLQPLEEVLGEELHYLLLVAVTELVTNAVVHGSQPGDLVTLRLEREPRVLCVAVEDASAKPPCLRTADHHDSGGRGMRLVAGLTKSWGYTRFASRPGKQVWMRIPHRGEAPAPSTTPPTPLARAAANH
ncbi:ATP-binding protein [Streptomyces sp. NPDC059816]|uniref:ATP-binding protein n=1 Tax=Streptomyces sp. NPDC059816 TaxID=3346960 RepID=UPI0036460538